MFTGIIEELGEVVTISTRDVERPDGAAGTVLQVRSRLVADGVLHGASIAVNGVCLTVIHTEPDAAEMRTSAPGTPTDHVPGSTIDLHFDVMGETLARTAIGALRPGDRVNLERPVRADGRLDGHIVQGHVDGIERVLVRTPGPAWESVRFSLGAGLARYVAEKGSITVNGVSLTVSAVADVPADGLPAAGWFEVGLIPETLRATNLGSAPPGTVVNIEVDVLAKYTERLLQSGRAGTVPAPVASMPAPPDEAGPIRLDPVERAIQEIAAGHAVVVVDAADRENEGDLIFAAELATPETLAFTIRHTSGYVCVALTADDATRLDLPPMHRINQDRRGTAYAVSVDARDGITTGISATDRARTVALLGASGTTPRDLTRPGHVVPLRAEDGGVLARAGHTEAAVELARLAGLHPAGALCEIVSERDPLHMARGPELREFADRHGLAMISIADLITYLHDRAPLVRRVAQARVPVRAGVFTALGFVSTVDAREHVAFVYGDPAQLRGAEDVLVRVHSECLTGDVFGSLRCDCGPQLDAALTAVARAGGGAVIYIRGHEGRGIGLLSKLAAYELQDGGADTLDANLDLGLPVDSRDYGTAAQIIADLGVRSVRLLSNNPDKTSGLVGYGVRVSGHVALPINANPENLRYLQTKRDRMGHTLVLDPVGPTVKIIAGPALEHGAS